MCGGTDCSVRGCCRQVDARSIASKHQGRLGRAACLLRRLLWLSRGAGRRGRRWWWELRRFGLGVGGSSCLCFGGVVPAPAPTAASTRSTPRSGGTHTPCHIPEEGVIPLRCSLNWCRHCGVRADEMVAIAGRLVGGCGGGRRGPGSSFGCGRSWYRGSGEDASGFERKRLYCVGQLLISWPPKHSRSASWTGARR